MKASYSKRISHRGVITTIAAVSVITIGIVGAWHANAQRRGSRLLRSIEVVSGDLDPSFYSGQPSIPPGVSRVSFGDLVPEDPAERADFSRGIALQTTGAVIVGGDSSFQGMGGNTQASQAYVLTRIKTDGTLDTSFGTLGKVKAKFVTGRGDAVNGIVVDPYPGAQQNYIYLFGSTSGASGCGSATDMAVVRYTDAGVLDSTWNVGGINSGLQTGKYIKDFKSCDDTAQRVVVNPDHSIVILCNSTQLFMGGPGTLSYTILIKLDALGVPVVGFDAGDPANTTGVVNSPGVVQYLNQGTAPPVVLGINPLNDFEYVTAPVANVGKFVGLTQSPAATPELQFIRFNSNGSVDTTFDTDGKQTVSFGGSSMDSYKDIAIQPDGKVLGAGGLDGSFIATRLTSTGAVDTFGTGGKINVPAPGSNGSSARYVGVMSNGKIILAGPGSTFGFPGTLRVAIARFSPAGALDTSSFGTSGWVFTTLGPNAGTNNVVVPIAGVMNSIDRIFITGQIQTPGSQDVDFFTAKFINAALTASSVSVSGRVMASAGRGLTNAIVMLTGPDGSSQTVVTGRGGNFNFDHVDTGKTYIISVGSQRFSYEPQTLTVNDSLSGLVFTPE